MLPPPRLQAGPPRERSCRPARRMNRGGPQLFPPRAAGQEEGSAPRPRPPPRASWSAPRGGARGGQAGGGRAAARGGKEEGEREGRERAQKDEPDRHDWLTGQGGLPRHVPRIAYDQREVRMAASDAWRTGVQQGRAERRMGSQSSSDIDLHMPARHTCALR